MTSQISAPREQRTSELDALRGVGAFVVLLHHLSLVMAFPQHTVGSKIVHSWPLCLAFAGHAAVLLFFVLSGYALTAMWQKSPLYGPYLVRRVCRIMLPLFATLALSAGLYVLLAPSPLPDVSDWVNGMIWNAPLTGNSVMRQALLFGLTNDISLDSVIWSLVYEMRVSLLFPLLYVACQRWPRSTAVGAVMLAAVTSWLRLKWGANYIGADYVQSFVLTLNTVPLFIAGIFLFMHREQLRSFLSFRQPWLWALCYVIISLLLIDKHDPVVGIGAVGLIAMALTHERGSRFLCSRPMLFLGKISYSLYLTHLVIVGALVHGTALRGWPLVGTAVVLALLFATVFNAVIERPSQALGRIGGKWLMKA